MIYDNHLKNCVHTGNSFITILHARARVFIHTLFFKSFTYKIFKAYFFIVGLIYH